MDFSSPSARGDAFLATTGKTVPRAVPCAVIELHYPKSGKGRPPVGLDRIPWMYYVQHRFNLADEGCEDLHAAGFVNN